MKSILLKNTRGFTLIETACYLTILALLLTSIASFHYLYRNRIMTAMKEITSLNTLQRFAAESEKTLFAIRTAEPDVIINAQDNHLKIIRDSGENNLCAWLNGRMEQMIFRENQFKKRTLELPVQDVIFSTRSQNKEKNMLKDITMVSIRFIIEKDYEIEYTINLN